MSLSNDDKKVVDFFCELSPHPRQIIEQAYMLAEKDLDKTKKILNVMNSYLLTPEEAFGLVTGGKLAGLSDRGVI